MFSSWNLSSLQWHLRCLLVLLVVAMNRATAQDLDDKMFAYTQIMSNCVGQQWTDQQTARLVTAVRRCEQLSPQPLRDRALEDTINQLQFSPQSGGGNGRVVYVPVAVNPALGGLGGFGVSNLGGNFPLNQFGTLNPTALNQGGFGGLNSFSTLGANQLGAGGGGFNRFNLNQDRFNLVDDNLNRRRPDSNFGTANNNNREGTSTGTFGLINTQTTSTNSNRNFRANNPFGFRFSPVLAKQTTEGISGLEEEIQKDELSPKDDKVHIRTTRQTRRDQLTRIEALNYLSNMTCVLREASMIDHNNLPNYQYFENEIRRIQVARDLRNNIATGLQFCKEMTQCMAVERLDHPLARELGQAIAYFRCIAKTNVKACKKAEERRSQGNGRLTGAFTFIGGGGNGLDLLNSVTQLALSDDALGFDFFF